MINREYDGTVSGAHDLGARIAERLQAGQRGALEDATDVLLTAVYELPAEHAHAVVTALLERQSRIVVAACALVKARGRFHTQREYEVLAAACKPEGSRTLRSEAMSAVSAVMCIAQRTMADGEDAARFQFLRDLQCCNLSIGRNEHATSYISAAEAIESGVFGNFADDPPDQVEAMKASNTIWSLQIYPRTPIGFDVYHGATLDSVIDRARADYAPPQAGEGG